MTQILPISNTTTFYNVKRDGAACDGVTDDTSKIATSITTVSGLGGGYVYLPGICAISSPLTLPANVSLIGAGNGTGLKALAGFSGAEMVLCSSNYTGVRNMILIGGPSTTYSSNPAITAAIQITAAAGVVVKDIFVTYINGWALQSSANGSAANYGCAFDNIHSYSGKQGIHTLGNTAQGFQMSQFLSNCNMDNIQNGDAYFFEDSDDIICSNLLSSMTGGSGASLHVKGACNAVFVTNPDLGIYPGPSAGPVVLIESGTNGSPNQIDINGGILEGGTPGITISAGTNISFRGCKIYNNGTHGVNATGGDNLLFDSCTFSGNGSTAGAGHYDIQISNGNNNRINKCYFSTPQGTTAGHVANAINAISGATYVENNSFKGTGFNSGNIFNSYAYTIRNNAGLNPIGVITPPTIGASPYTSPVQSFDYTVFVKGGTVSAIAINGNVTGLTLASGAFVTIRVPAQSTVTLTYTVAPTWTWFGD